MTGVQDEFRTNDELLDELAKLRKRNTEWEKLQSKTEEQIARFASFPNLNPNAVIEVDSSGEVTFFNRAAERALEELGMDKGNIKALLPEDLSAFLIDCDKEQPAITREIIIEDRIFSENICFAPRYSVARIYVTDITEHRRMEKETRQLLNAVRESEERYRTAIESATDGIALVQGDRHIYVNARFAEIFGFDSPRDIIGKPLSLTVHPDNVEMVSDINRMRQGGGSAPLRYEFKGVTKDGEVRFIEVAAARTNYRGEPTSLAYLRDITDYKNLEDQLRQSQKMEAIGTLAGGIAHDFNNILAAIVGFTEMAIDDVPDHPLVEKNLRNVLGSAMRARDLVRQILTFSRKTGHERTPTALSPVVKETVHLLRASIPATIEIKLSITATSDTVLAAPIEVQQVLMNLATNASLAMEEKGGILEISLTDIDLMPDSPVFANLMPGEYVQLIVKDTGIGMSADVMKRVFEPFFTTRGLGEGTGMGLAVVYGIATDLQGTITMESEPGIGSTFRIFLPKVKAAVKEDQMPTHQIPMGTESILFIDDEELLVEWAKATLQRLGYDVTALTDPAEALKTFSSDPSRFDLVITDQAMPSMAGMHLARKLFNIRPDVPIILCTGHSATVSAETAKTAGIKKFLMKPVTRQELAEVIRQALDTKK